ncbi:MAG: tRNA 2-thiouridine(34) synthase MnmA [Deltaproteobacteria bacterium]|nr:tRNA 2-thiouridine(34) synthase MnmA [Deltaproteobacteria bacterium]
MSVSGGKKIIVAMSGGVDSSVAALLLRQKGCECIGVSMQVWDYRSNGGCSSRATCCAPDDFTDARKVAARVGIPYYVFDFEDSFRDKVIAKFVRSYSSGITPNPCVDCNSKVKFLELRRRAAAMSGGEVATGHYARIEKRGDELKLLRGRDRAKDQSYFLYGLKRNELAQTHFPVGHLTKSEVREIAKQHGLATAEKPESQDICFVTGTVGEFLSRAGEKSRPGEIVTISGGHVGYHDGIHNFTVGQRRGLNLGGNEEPLYVLELDASANQVIVGSKRELERPQFRVGELNWLSEEAEKEFASKRSGYQLECIVQVRSRHAGAPARITIGENGEAVVTFLSSPATVSPGQAAVFYDRDNEVVIGGGRIALQNGSLRVVGNRATPQPASADR